MSDQLAKDMLFFCACAAQPSPDMQLPRLATVRQAYGLEEGALPDYEAPVLGRVDPAWMVMGRKRLAADVKQWQALAGAMTGLGVLEVSRVTPPTGATA